MLAMLRFAWRAPLHQAAHASGLVAEGGAAMSGERDSAWRMEGCHSTYWPQHELDSFILKMAGHGQAVHAAMMLGDLAYARQQLAAAASIDCPQLRALSLRLSAYFDHPPCASSIDTH